MTGEGARDVSIAPSSRRRRRWLAFLLNLLFPAAGYVYAGFPAYVLRVWGILIGLLAVAVVWTVASPPGAYGLVARASNIKPAVSLLGWGLALTLAVHAAWLSRRPPASSAQGWRLLALALSAPMAGALVLRLYGPVATYTIMSGSMEPTLSAGDVILSGGARAACGGQPIEAGDVVIFHRGGVTYPSRAIARGGQSIAVRAGVPVVDDRPFGQRTIGGWTGKSSSQEPATPGRLLEETTSAGARYRVVAFSEPQPQDDFPQTKVPRGTWFLMGDNRDDSRDSRFIGAVPEHDICGVATKVLFSQTRSRIGARP